MDPEYLANHSILVQHDSILHKATEQCCMTIVITQGNTTTEKVSACIIQIYCKAMETYYRVAYQKSTKNTGDKR